MEARSVPACPQVFPQELGILAAPTPRTYMHLCAPSHSALGRGASSLGERVLDPPTLWIRAGPEGGEAGGPLKGLERLPTRGKPIAKLPLLSLECQKTGCHRPSQGLHLTQSCNPHVPPSPLSRFRTVTLLFQHSPSRLRALSYFCLDCPPRLVSSNFAFSGRPSLNPLANRHLIPAPNLFPFGLIARTEIL